ncbi:hypothetical protein ACLM5H_04685 [Fredinandcohnia humi]
MKKSEWNDEQLENLLAQMPTIKDNRSPREIYQNISLKVNKKKKKNWVVPSIATAAAALLLFILAPTFFNNSSFDLSSSGSDKESIEHASLAEERSPNSSEESADNQVNMLGESKEAAEGQSIQNDEKPTYVVKEIKEDEVLLTYGVYLGGVMFPTVISIVVESDGTNIIEQFEKNIPLVNDVIRRNPSWGIDEFPQSYFSDFVEIVQSDGTKVVRADIAENINPESFASAEMSSFGNAISSFRYLLEDYQHVELYKNGIHGLPNGDWEIGKNVDVEKDTKKAYLFYMHEENGYKVLAPTFDDYNTIKEAIAAMKESLVQGDYQLHPTITKSADIENIVEDDTDLEITFSDDAGLENNDTFILAVEAIMLTAKEFGFETVTFNGNIEKIGDVTFGEPVAVPLAPNPFHLQ